MFKTYYKFNKTHLIAKEYVGHHSFGEGWEFRVNFNLNCNKIESKLRFKPRKIQLDHFFSRKDVSEYKKILDKRYKKNWAKLDKAFLNLEIVLNFQKDVVDFKKCSMDQLLFLLPEYGSIIKGDLPSLDRVQDEIYGVILRMIKDSHKNDPHFNDLTPPNLFQIQYQDEKSYHQFLINLKDALFDYNSEGFNVKSINSLNKSLSILKEVQESNFRELMASYLNGLSRNLCKEKYIIKCNNRDCNKFSKYAPTKKYCSISCRKKAHYQNNPAIKKKNKKRMREQREFYKKHDVRK